MMLMSASQGVDQFIGTIASSLQWIAFVAVPAVAVFLWEMTEGWPDLARMLFLLAVFFLWPSALVEIYKLIRKWFQPGKLFGTARFASLLSVWRAGMLQPGGRFLGQLKGRDLYLHGEGHTLTVAAQGGGKTTSLIIPTLLTYSGGSVIVTDPKGAITAQTRRFRSDLGRVVVLNPWCDELKNDPSFGVDLGDDGFNPLQSVSLDQSGRAAAALVASLILPDMPGEDGFWRQEGRELLEWAMLWQSVNLKAEQRTLPHLRAFLYDVPELVALLEVNAKEDREGPGRKALKNGASKFYGLIAMGAGSQLSGVIGTATTALKIYDEDTRLAAHVSRAGFNLADLKGDKPITLFIICPPDHLIGDDRKWLNLVLSLICQQVGKPGRAQETVLLMDEFPALGYLPNLMGSLEQFREAGLRAHLIAQNVGQVLNIYGADGLRRLWGVSENKAFFRITDPEQARLISDWCGQRTERQASKNSDGKETVSEVGIPLVRPEDLLRMPPDRQIIIRPHMDPIRAKVFPYFKRSEWAGLVDANPYRGKA